MLARWRPRGPEEEAAIRAFGPQLGEIAFHAITVDGRIESVASQHAAEIVRSMEAYLDRPADRPLRLLEIGAYCHFSAALAASQLGAEATVHDISAVAIKTGAELAAKRGIAPPALVAGDFHDLPFADGYFDIVFCSACIHHTWRPAQVLRELARIVRPGGLVHLDTEPVLRAACFYQFRSRRPEAYSGIEAVAETLGMIPTLSSPYPGSRSEQLFGMIENDRIPLGTYLRTISETTDIVELKLESRMYNGPFDSWLLELDPSDPLLEQTISARLHENMSEIAKAFDAADTFAGHSLPDSDACWLLAYRIAERLRALPAADNRELALGELFGGELRIIARKRGAEAGSVEKFRRVVAMRDGVAMDLPEAIDNVLPRIGEPAIAEVFPAADWTVVDEANGYQSVANLSGAGRIALPAGGGLLMLRVYSVFTETPYVFWISVAGEPRYQHVVTSGESHLAKLLVRDGQEVDLRLTDLQGSPVSLPWHTRIGVAALLPAGQTLA